MMKSYAAGAGCHWAVIVTQYGVVSECVLTGCSGETRLVLHVPLRIYASTRVKS